MKFLANLYASFSTHDENSISCRLKRTLNVVTCTLWLASPLRDEFNSVLWRYEN